jgi:hypothetical protein
MGHKKRKQPEKNTPTYLEAATLWLSSDPGPRVAIPVLALLTAALLVPFTGKAFHMDDPLFLKAAHQIIAHPFDPYGFTVNWYQSEMPMSAVMKNPPLASYYIAAVASIFGWSEAVLHLAFMPFAIAVIVGTYALARRYATPPVLAALAVLTSPLFLVTSTNIMCDTLMSALFIWAVVLWIDGITHNSSLKLGAAGCLATLAVLTKYFALSALPLMLIYSLLHRRRFTISILALALPVVVLIGYHYWTAALYGHGLLSDAAEYANLMRWQEGATPWGKIIVGLGFVGPILPCTFLLGPRLFRHYQLAGGVILAIAASLLIIWGVVPTGAQPVSDEYRTLLTFESALLIVTGLIILATVLTAWRPGADPELILLILWVIGTFAFGSIINWTVNVRSLMPLGPPAAILLVRRLTAHGKPIIQLTAASLIAAALLSLAVCWGDYRLAGAGREAAARILSLPRSEGTMIWFQGHWGFQHYMEEGGAKAFDVRASRVGAGDLIVIPNNNDNIVGINPQISTYMGRLEFAASSWVTTTNSPLGAGFYAHIFGPLPFVFGPVPPECYDVVKVHYP